MAKEIQFRHVRSRDYKIVYSSGAFGGVTPKGEFKMDLFIDYSPSPDVITHSVTGDGLGPVIRREPESSPIVREAQVGVVMSVSEAKNLGAWLLQQVRAFEENKKTE